MKLLERLRAQLQADGRVELDHTDLAALLDVVEAVERFRDDADGEGWDEVRAALERLAAQ